MILKYLSFFIKFENLIFCTEFYTRFYTLDSAVIIILSLRNFFTIYYTLRNIMTLLLKVIESSWE